ncbi:MAG: NACHT domain-containing protein [Blastochloris sp.]|nr:NACHT domain-containing protein [Blastochloris sp.]
MSVPFLTTKLSIPPTRPTLVSRLRLITHLDGGLRGKLTLVLAPAGCGKTTLLSTWAAGCDRPVAWLALDEGDRDPMQFLRYLVAALQTIIPTIGAGVANLLQSPQPPPIMEVVPTLLNVIAAIPHQVVLVLDDYHVIDSAAIDEALAWLIDHLPPNLHLVIATRATPNIPLARLRVRNQLSEVRAADLRFTTDEAADFLNRVMGLRLTANDIAVLEARTEGWIAGLQLAALSLRERSDAAGFVASFSGNHHFVLDYLLEEVLHRQPAAIQTFLLRTAILDRLCGALCDAVLNDPSIPGQATLEYCERANLFLIPLDHERRWYRYHHLFVEMLRQRLAQHASSEQVVELHRRAAIWYEAQGDAVTAFQHAAAAGDVDRALHLIAGNGTALHFRGAVSPVLHWLDTLAPAILDARPALRVIYASAATVVGRPIDTVEAHLHAAERALQEAADDDATRDLHGQIAAIRAMLAIPQNQVSTILEQSRRALNLLHQDNLAVRTTTSWTLGFAYQLQNNRAAAAQAYADAITTSKASGNLMISIGATTCLGQVQEAGMECDRAAITYRRVLELVGDPPLPYGCEAYLGLARLAYAWNDLDAAEQYGQQSLALAQQIANVDTPVAALLLLARVAFARGDEGGATTLLADAEQVADQRQAVHRLPGIVDLQVQVLLRRGDVATAAELAQRVDDPLSQVRVHLARNEPASALALLEPLRRQAQERPDEVLQITLLQAIAYLAQGEPEQALHQVEAALRLAAPQSLIRPFVDAGPLVAQLLTQMQVGANGLARYREQLLAAFAPQSDPDRATHSANPLFEPLSAREIEILHLIAAGMSNQQIAEHLALAESTVKGYNRNLFGKLQVQRRTEAIARARELGIL